VIRRRSAEGGIVLLSYGNRNEIPAKMHVNKVNTKEKRKKRGN